MKNYESLKNYNEFKEVFDNGKSFIEFSDF